MTRTTLSCQINMFWSPSYATAAVLWYDGLGRTVATADYGREDVIA